MAPWCRRQEYHSADVPKFVKIIVNPRDHRLRIPTSFTQKYGHDLPNCVSIKVPDGSEWKMELVHSNGDIWLQKGFKEFKEYYSLDFGYILVFEYDGGSMFDVLIFDITASEIEYDFYNSSHDTSNNLKKRVSRMDKIGSESDDSVEILEELTNKKCERRYLNEANQANYDVSIEEFSVPLARWVRKRKTLKGDDDIPTRKSVRGMQNHLRPRIRGEGGEGSRMQFAKNLQKPVDKETSKAYQMAKAFKDDNPSKDPSFVALMQPTYVLSLNILSIPISFAKEYMPNKHTDITLRVSNRGKIWPMRCSFNNRNAWISCGWKEFVRENVLKVGDACFFKLNENKLAWNVTIFRCSN